MWLIKSPIESQLCEFILFKVRTKGELVAKRHKVWLDLFWSKSKVNSVLDIKPDHVLDFKEWLESHYNGRYTPEEALRTLNQFLRFYKLQHLMEAVKKKRKKFGGRTLDTERKELAQKLAKAGIGYRDIRDFIYRKTGRKPSLSAISFWVNLGT